MKLDLRQALKDRSVANLPLAKPDDIVYIPKQKNLWRSVLSITRDLTTFALPHIIFPERLTNKRNAVPIWRLRPSS